MHAAASKVGDERMPQGVEVGFAPGVVGVSQEVARLSVLTLLPRGAEGRGPDSRASDGGRCLPGDASDAVKLGWTDNICSVLTFNARPLDSFGEAM